MHQKDLEPYRFRAGTIYRGLRAVGWLDQEHPYERGINAAGTIEALKRLMLEREAFNVHVALIRSIHPCDFCGRESFPEIDPENKMYIGSTEVWLPAASRGEFFSSPSLIIHYMKDHHYRPPQAYIDAILNFDPSKGFNAEEEWLRISGEAMKGQPEPQINIPPQLRWLLDFRPPGNDGSDGAA